MDKHTFIRYIFSKRIYISSRESDSICESFMSHLESVIGRCRRLGDAQRKARKKKHRKAPKKNYPIDCASL